MTSTRRNKSKRKGDHPDRARYVTFCRPCEKYAYATFAEARRAARQHFPGAHLSAYRCPHTLDGAPDLYHFGHLPKEQIAGDEPEWWTRGIGKVRRPPKTTPETTP